MIGHDPSGVEGNIARSQSFDDIFSQLKIDVGILEDLQLKADRRFFVELFELLQSVLDQPAACRRVEQQ